MAIPLTSGFIPEADSKDHWVFENKLRPLLIESHGERADLRPYSSPRHNQTKTNTCTAQSVAKALEILTLQDDRPHVDLSVLALYYLGRELMVPPQTHIDSGSTVSAVCDAARRFGVPPEEDWPYDLTKINVSPSWKAMRAAHGHRIGAFYKIVSKGEERLTAIRQALHHGFPVVFGTKMSAQWPTYKGTDVLTIPKIPQGRHTTCLVGFKGDLFIGENSWGTSWGEDGFYWMAPDYLTWEDSLDFWVISL